MKKVCASLVAVCLVATIASTASANYVLKNGDKVKVLSTVHGLGTSTYAGGPFNVEVWDPKIGEQFISFCIEKNESVSISGIYTVTVDRFAVKGGVDNNVRPPLNDEPDKDYVSDAAGTLYQAFRLSTLLSAGIGWTGSDSDLIALQNAFWQLEDEPVTQSESDQGTVGMQTALVAWADANRTPNHLTRAINLMRADGSHAQSMLTLVPEPASVAVWGFIATVFGGGMYLRRRRSK